jgi:hypothetical protein
MLEDVAAVHDIKRSIREWDGRDVQLDHCRLHEIRGDVLEKIEAGQPRRHHVDRREVQHLLPQRLEQIGALAKEQPDQSVPFQRSARRATGVGPGHEPECLEVAIPRVTYRTKNCL